MQVTWLGKLALHTHRHLLLQLPSPTYRTLYSQATGPERGCEPSQATQQGRGGTVLGRT